ncbi:MAG: RsmE family RNA methyltransferase [Myxococcales bacterium]|nr:RsmE family RNA methyltransferase [Myxococcales bacterium]
MNRILVPGRGAVGQRILAGQSESHHLLDVQRVARGRMVRVSDGAGWQADAELVGVEDGCAVLEVRAIAVSGVVPERVIVLGMPKATSLEEALVLGTEAGATAFVLVRASRSPPGDLRADRLERVLRAALTQCGRSEVPVIRRAAVGALGVLPDRRYVATPGATGAGAGATGATAPPSSTWAGSDGAALAVGPEGGWTEEEQTALGATGFVPLGLGPFILRTPTAVAVGLGWLWGAAG